jgi:hypothetical protein
MIYEDCMRLMSDFLTLCHSSVLYLAPNISLLDLPGNFGLVCSCMSVWIAFRFQLKTIVLGMQSSDVALEQNSKQKMCNVLGIIHCPPCRLSLLWVFSAIMDMYSCSTVQCTTDKPVSQQASH